MTRLLPLALCAAALLAGCAAPSNRLPPGVSRAQEARCEAQSTAAAAATNRTSLPRQADLRLRDDCLRAYVFENAEEIGRVLGFRWEIGQGRLSNEQRAAVGGLAEGCGAPAEHLDWMRAQIAPHPAEVAAWRQGLQVAPQATGGACALARSVMASLVAQRAGR
ncbi:hypothetical protein L2E76_05850 [Planktothrix agardhii 1811]|uniref:hypothetical protein n=1 Tax=Planktothrix agardhii TaxID=1160 RepID=UPI001F3E55C9|nr:hypothetical protein [Planktothrix agardhii]MCF3580045.1 hypothetical protein [Planktothrix agardhii 1811]